MKAVYAGSFNPFTNGHRDVALEAARIFDEVFIVFARNPKKEPGFPDLTMVDAVANYFKRMNVTNITVTSSSILTADMCNLLGAEYLVRGVRNTTDFMYEEEIAKFNQRIKPGLKTIYLRAVDDTISSSMVRELLTYGMDISQYVPHEVEDVIKKEWRTE